MPIDLMAGLMGGLAALMGIVGARWVVAYIRADGDSPLRTAFRRTGTWSMALVGGAASASAMGLLSVADLVGQLVAFIGAHPYFASNLGTVGLGAGVVSGLVSLSTTQFVGVGLAIIGAVMLVVEVDA